MVFARCCRDVGITAGLSISKVLLRLFFFQKKNKKLIYLTQIKIIERISYFLTVVPKLLMLNAPAPLIFYQFV